MVRIDEIQVGDTVRSLDIETGEIVVREVTSVNNGTASYYYVINGNLRVSPPHPFYTVNEGWVPVENLEIGDEILGIDGFTVIETIETVQEELPVFNIGVEGGTYLVTADSNDFYLVHQGE